MSDIEKTIATELAKLPADVQDKFLMMAQGAAMAAESLKAEQKQEEDSDDD